jgi:hypothetical protein
MAIAESIAPMEKDVVWKSWAAKGWTLRQTPDGQVMAVNVAEHRATEKAKRLEALISQLEKGVFNYKEFLDFKKLHSP